MDYDLGAALALALAPAPATSWAASFPCRCGAASDARATSSVRLRELNANTPDSRPRLMQHLAWAAEEFTMSVQAIERNCTCPDRPGPSDGRDHQ